MTLVELIVGMLLFAIIAASVSAILVPMLRIQSHANELAEQNALLDTVANQIIGNLSSATVPLKNPGADNEIYITVDNPDDVKYTVDESNGIMLKNGSPVFSKSFYKNKSISFFCKETQDDSKKVYELTVIILSDKGGEIIRRNYAVRPLALNQY